MDSVFVLSTVYMRTSSLFFESNTCYDILARIVCEETGFFSFENKAVTTCLIWIYVYEENRKVDVHSMAEGSLPGAEASTSYTLILDRIWSGSAGGPGIYHLLQHFPDGQAGCI